VSQCVDRDQPGLHVWLRQPLPKASPLPAKVAVTTGLCGVVTDLFSLRSPLYEVAATTTLAPRCYRSSSVIHFST
jgi:hypothetical protein